MGRAGIFSVLEKSARSERADMVAQQQVCDIVPESLLLRDCFSLGIYFFFGQHCLQNKTENMH